MRRRTIEYKKHKALKGVHKELESHRLCHKDTQLCLGKKYFSPCRWLGLLPIDLNVGESSKESIQLSFQVVMCCILCPDFFAHMIQVNLSFSPFGLFTFCLYFFHFHSTTSKPRRIQKEVFIAATFTDVVVETLYP